MSSFHKMCILTSEPPVTFIFLVFRKTGLIKSCLSFEDMLAYKITWSRIDWCKFYIYLSSLKIPPPYPNIIFKYVYDPSLYQTSFV
jgi:hypothetical protein